MLSKILKGKSESDIINSFKNKKYLKNIDIYIIL